MKATSEQIYLFHQGTYYHAYELLGCHLDTEKGAWFRVFAPNAKSISVVGDFNNWNNTISLMKKIDNTSIWECYVENAKELDKYKYCITTSKNIKKLKADPYAFYSETNGKTASIIYNLEGYKWQAEDNKNYSAYESPMNIYEVNLCSWKRKENGDYYTYGEIEKELIPYCLEMNYTHIEFMPLTEYPFDGSWGYQVTGYFSVTARFGTPKEFMHLVDACHKNGIKVILDWVPAHFPKDEHGLIEFDGKPLYENAGWDKIEHKSWGTRRFDYGRCEVQSFLVSSAMFFFKKFKVDGLRVDAVASMLYLDYDKKPNEWLPNSNGDNKNLEAIAFLQKLNKAVFSEFPNAIMIAEESTAWPLVTKPTNIGGLGFNFKWNIGWMNDMLEYIQLNPFYRKDNHDKLTFSMFYAFSENFILPISHDEVVHGKGSLLDKMNGEYNDKFDQLRTFLSYMIAHPGKKLTFMGTELGQFKEWDNAEGIDFCLLKFDKHWKTQHFVKDLNYFYLNHPELYEDDFSWTGFEWIVPDDNKQNVVVFKRKDKHGNELICAINFSPVTRENYKIGVCSGKYEEIFTTDLEEYGGKGITNKISTAKKNKIHGQNYSIEITLPAYSTIFLKKIQNKISI